MQTSKPIGNPNLDAALGYLRVGYRPIPLCRAEGGACIYHVECNAPGKRPLIKWGGDYTPDEGSMREWWDRWPDANVGLATGKTAGLVVLDVDNPESLHVLEAAGGMLPESPIVKTSRGMHLYFKHPGERIKNSASSLGDGLDIRGDGGLVVVPPSIHADGTQYIWNRPLAETELPPLPEWVLARLSTKAGSESTLDPTPLMTADRVAMALLQRAAVKVATEQVGGRNDRLNAAAFEMGKWVFRGDLPQEAVEDSLLKAALLAGLGVDESVGTIASALDAAIRNHQASAEAIEPEVLPPDKKTLTPADLADEFNRPFLTPNGTKLLSYRNTWWLWDGRCFCPLQIGELRAHVIAYLQAGDEARRKAARGSMVNDVLLNLAAKSLVPERVEIPVWIGDNGTYTPAASVVPLANGILDVELFLEDRDEFFMEHSPALFSTMVLPFNFDPSATCPTWEAFLHQVLPDASCRMLLQEFFGYCLTTDVSHQKALILLGEGANGKSTALEVLCKLIGRENFSTIPLVRFGQQFALAESVGRLANVVNEIGEFDKADEAVLKNYISGEAMTFERKNQQPFTARPTARLIFATNNLPRFTDRSGGIWRRFFILPFQVVIPAELQDPQLGEKLSLELPGIFLWALEGLKTLRERGKFAEPVISATEKEALRQATNPAREFLSDTCTEVAEGSVPKQTLYAAYRSYCQERGYTPLNDANFGKEVNRHFATVGETQKTVDGRRIRFYVGIQYLEGKWQQHLEGKWQQPPFWMHG